MKWTKWKHLANYELDTHCIKFWKQYDLIKCVNKETHIAILDGHMSDKQLEPQRTLNISYIQSPPVGVWGDWIFPIRKSEFCDRWIWMLKSDIFENLTLAKYARKIQHAWRTFRAFRHAAASRIQYQFRLCITNPNYMLCKKRLMWEFNHMA